MKKMVFVLFVSMGANAMENNNQPSSTSKIVDSLLTKIVGAIETYDASNQADAENFRKLVSEYFEHESNTIDEEIKPYVAQHMAARKDELQKILIADDAAALQNEINQIIAQSVDDAFKSKTDEYEQLRQLADKRLTQSKVALATAIITGILGITATFVGVWFGHA